MFPKLTVCFYTLNLTIYFIQNLVRNSQVLTLVIFLSPPQSSDISQLCGLSTRNYAIVHLLDLSNYFKLKYFSPLFYILKHLKIILLSNAGVVFPTGLNEQTKYVLLANAVAQLQSTNELFLSKVSTWLLLISLLGLYKVRWLRYKEDTQLHYCKHSPARIVHWLWIFYRSWRQRPLASSINPQKRYLC